MTTATPAVVSGPSKLATKFRTLADGLTKKIEDKTRPMSQAFTPKRGREYNQRVHDGENLRRTQTALLALASAIESGTLPEILADVKTKDDVFMMVRTRGVSQGYYDYHDSREPCDSSERAVLLRALASSSRTIEQVVAEEYAKHAQVLIAKVDALCNCDIPGFFPTPAAVGAIIMNRAKISADHLVLEPSAGIGSLAELCPEPANVSCVECQYSLIDILEAKGFKTWRGDFMECNEHDLSSVQGTVNSLGHFDRIIMNPPFEKSADASHIQHAFKFLKPGGRLVAICSAGPFFRSDRKATEFREWLFEAMAEVEDLPAGCFDSIEAFRRTGTSCKLVVIEAAA